MRSHESNKSRRRTRGGKKQDGRRVDGGLQLNIQLAGGNAFFWEFHWS